MTKNFSKSLTFNLLKFFYFIFLCSCTHKPENSNISENSEYHFSLLEPLKLSHSFTPKYGAIQFLKDSKTIIGYQVQQHHFEFLDMIDNHRSYIVTIDSQGPDGINTNSIKKFYYRENEKIFLILTDTYLYDCDVSNYKIHIKNKISLSQINPNSDHSQIERQYGMNIRDHPYYPLEFIEPSNKLLVRRFKNIHHIPNDSLYFDVGLLNLDKRNFSTIKLKLPKSISQAATHFNMLNQPNVSMKGLDSIVVSLPFTNKLWIYSLSDHESTEKTIQNSLIKDEIRTIQEYTGAANEIDNLEMEIRYFANAEQYFPIHWDNSRGLFYRIQKISNNPESLAYNARSIGERSLSVIDSNYKLVYEIPLPKEYENTFMVSKEGLLFILKEQPYENQYQLGLLKFNLDSRDRDSNHSL